MENKFHKVLIVDDAADIRRVIRAYLETLHHCEVVEAANGVDAVKQSLASAFDLIITDLIMPEMTGLELTAYLKKSARLRHIPVVMLTSQGEEKDRRKAMALGVAEYLVKPFTPLSMKPVLDKYLHPAP